VLTLGIMFDKLRLLEGKPQSIKSTLNLSDLAQQFRELAQPRTVVAVQELKDETDSHSG
jgi:hypothetical protein